MKLACYHDMVYTYSIYTYSNGQHKMILSLFECYGKNAVQVLVLRDAFDYAGLCRTLLNAAACITLKHPRALHNCTSYVILLELWIFYFTAHYISLHIRYIQHSAHWTQFETNCGM